MACKKDICSGDLNRVVAVQESVRVDDGAGGFTNGPWNTLFTIYCAVKTAKGNESFRHQQIEATATYEFTTRYRSDLMGKEIYRLLLEGEPYNIRSIEDVDLRHAWIVISAERGVMD